MPFLGLIDETLSTPHEADDDASVECPGCGGDLTIRNSHRRNGSFVARHFLHPTKPAGGCSGGPGGESAEHKRLKSIAASKAEAVFADSTVSIEESVGDRRADVLVEFEHQHDMLGKGIAIEVQHKHHTKDKKAVQEEFRSNGYSVLWLDSEHFDGHDVDLGAGTTSKWWAAQVPRSDEWSGYHGIVKWLQQPLNPPVERTVPFPDELFTSEYSLFWAKGLFEAYSEDGDGQSVFSAPLFDSDRTRSEIGLAVDWMGRPQVYIRKTQGEKAKYERDPNLRRRLDDLRRLSNILSEWDADWRRDWAERTTDSQSGPWVPVWDISTGTHELRLLCQQDSGNPVVCLNEHYEGDVTARVDPQLAAESIRRTIITYLHIYESESNLNNKSIPDAEHYQQELS